MILVNVIKFSKGQTKGGGPMGNRKLAEMKSLYNELSVVHHLSSIITSTLCLDDVLKKTAELTSNIMQVDGCHLLLIKNLIEELKLETAAYCGDYAMPEGIDFAKSGLSGLAIAEKRIVIVSDAEVDPRTIKEVVRLLKVRSILCVPIIVRDEALGVINVHHSKPNYFTQKHAEFLSLLANQAGIAISNARLFKQMENIANTDGLTGLYNHRYFHTALEQRFTLMSQNPGQQLSLLMMDLDNFKHYNDLYGHPAGDALLQEFAQLLTKLVSTNDVVARYGGDEFTIILHGQGTQQAAEIAKRIIEASENFVFTNTGVAVSIGIASYPEINDKNQLIEQADRDLYHNKADKKQSSVG